MALVLKKVQSCVTENEQVKRIILTIPILALMLLGAHSLRVGDYGQTAAWLLLVGLVFTRQAWVRLVWVMALMWGGFIWADATVEFINFRQALGAPWLRLALIMGGVILFDALALSVLVGRTAKNYFDQGYEQAWFRCAIFALTVFGLAMARSNVSFPVLLLDRYLPEWGCLEIVVLGLYAQWIGGLMMLPKGHRTVRPRIWALFSVVFFAQLVLGLFGMDRMLMTGSLHLPVPALIVAGPIFRGDGFFMIILFLVTVLLVGPAWCSHLCYIGAWDDAMSRLGKRPGPDSSIARLTVLGRAGTLVLVVMAALVLRSTGVSGSVAVLLAALFGLAGVALMVSVSRKKGMMVHCSAYCPMGIVANVLGKLTPWRIRIGSDCTQCGACFSRCRYNALDEPMVRRGRPGISCTMCGDCISACSHRQIEYGFTGLSPDSARKVFLVLVVSLHAIFLGVARI